MTTFLTPTELAARWRCSRGHLANLRHRAQGPAYLKPTDGSVLYDLAVIEEYEQNKTIKPIKKKEK